VVRGDTLGLHHQKDGGGDHGNGDDPERDSGVVILSQETVLSDEFIHTHMVVNCLNGVGDEGGGVDGHGVRIKSNESK